MGRGIGDGRGRNERWGERGTRIGRNDGDGTCRDRDRADLGRLSVDARCPDACHHHHGYAASRDHHAHRDGDAHPSAHHHPRPVDRRSPSTGRGDDHHESAADLCSVDPGARYSTMRQWVHERRDRRGERGHGNSVTLGDDVNATGRRDFLMSSGTDGRPGSGSTLTTVPSSGMRLVTRPGPVTVLFGSGRGRLGHAAAPAPPSARHIRR